MASPYFICDYCGNRYFERLDECPTCGAHAMIEHNVPAPAPAPVAAQEAPRAASGIGIGIPNTSPFYDMSTGLSSTYNIVPTLIVFAIATVGISFVQKIIK